MNPTDELNRFLRIGLARENFVMLEESGTTSGGLVSLESIISPGVYYLVLSAPGYVLREYRISLSLAAANPVQIYGLGAGPNALDFSPDGRFLATAGNRGAALWDIESGGILRALEAHTAEVLDVAFSSDGTRLATAGADAKIKVWDVQSGLLLGTLYGSLQGNGESFTKITFANHDQHLLAATGYNYGSHSTGIKIFALQGFSLQGELQGQDFAIDSDGSSVLVSHVTLLPEVGPQTRRVIIRSYNLQTATFLDELEFEVPLDQFGGYPSVSSSIASSSLTGNVWLALHTTISAPYSGSTYESHLFEIDLDANTAHKVEHAEPHSLYPGTGETFHPGFYTIAVDPLGQKVIAHGRYVDTASRTSVELPVKFNRAVFGPAGVLALADAQTGRVRILDIETLNGQRQFARHSPPVRAMEIASNSTLATNQGDLWDIASAEPIHRTDILVGTISPDGAKRYTAYREYDTDLQRTVALNIEIHDTVSDDRVGGYRLTDIVDGLYPGIHSTYSAPVALRISPDGQRMIGDESLLNIWDAMTGENSSPIVLPPGVVSPCYENRFA